MVHHVAGAMQKLTKIEPDSMSSALDVAAYILQSKGQMSTWKLQKLVYYSQAWSLVWDEEPLFDEEIQAWVNGPVCPALYEEHKGKFSVRAIQGGNPDNLTDGQKETVDSVVDFYGDWSPQRLSGLTHMEDPWKDAREGVPPRERSTVPISLESMAQYYESIGHG